MESKTRQDWLVVVVICHYYTVCNLLLTLVVAEWQMVEWHFWLKKNEILSQVGDWINDLETYSTDKRVGRSIAHSCTSLKVRHLTICFDFPHKNLCIYFFLGIRIVVALCSCSVSASHRIV